MSCRTVMFCLVLALSTGAYLQTEANSTTESGNKRTTHPPNSSETLLPRNATKGSAKNDSYIATTTPFTFNSTETETEFTNNTPITNETEFTNSTPITNETEFTNSTPINNVSEEIYTQSSTSLPFPGAEMLPTDVPLKDANVPCVCDLTSNECDINCCCDHLCSDADRQAFKSCGMPLPQPNADYCFQEDFIFINNTPFTLVKTSDNLFCIYKDNYQSRFQYKNVSTVTDITTFNKVVSKYLQFPWPSQNDVPKDAEDVLKIGAPIYTRFDSGLVGYLEIPTSTFSGECNAANPASYLHSESNVCSQLITNLKLECSRNAWLDSQTYFQGFMVARSPAALKGYTNGTTDDFVAVSPELCHTLFSVPISCNATEPSEIPSPSFNDTSGSCDHVVLRAEYVISHNGTEGIHAVSVRLTLGVLHNATPTASMLRWTQIHGVNYVWSSSSINGTSGANKTNSSLESPIRYSGNPGYLVGAPVLAGKMISRDVSIDGTVPDRRAGINLSRDSSNWLTIVGAVAGGNGRCLGLAGEGISSRMSVRFGENLHTGCVVALSTKNLTTSCSDLQGAILDLLLGTEPPDVVGAYGNSRVESPGEWVPVLRDGMPPPSRVVSEVSCSNIVRELHLQILFANFGSFANPQAKIVGVQLRFGTPVELQLRCAGRFCQAGTESLTQMLSITSSVSFVDTSETAVPVYAEHPTIRIELPNDFFYPFSSSAPSAAKLSFILYIASVLTTCMVIYYNAV